MAAIASTTIPRRTKLAVSAAALTLLAAMQCVRPSLHEDVPKAEVAVPPTALQVLKTSCYSCHSNERRLAWFDEVAPAYWLVHRDITEARSHLNFSTLGAKPPAAQRAALYEAVNMAALGSMPIKSYSLLHPEARVKQDELERLEAYLAPWQNTPGLAPEPAPLLLKQNAEPTASGLDFDAAYSQWHLLSITDRGDNNTFRMILGNDVAMRAARNGQISPWPDEARLAKVAWQQRSAPDGTIRPGPFLQVELMVKDERRYRDSDGWGWGRWKGPALKPYGTNPHVVEECTGCHAPMKRNDFVYTMPIGRSISSSDHLNGLAALPELPFDPLTAMPLTLTVDRAHATISALFKNKAAGNELLLVTWKERDDPHWFGAKMPAAFVRAEYIRDAGTRSQKYSCIPAHATDIAALCMPPQSRIDFINQLKPAQSIDQ